MCSDGYWFGDGDVKEILNVAVTGAGTVEGAGAVADPGHWFRLLEQIL